MTRVLVCGGRDFADSEYMDSVLKVIAKELGGFDLIQGCARGADIMSRDWAVKNGLKTYDFSADWDKYGKRAGSVRNQQMLDEGKPDLVVAFPGGRHGSPC